MSVSIQPQVQPRHHEVPALTADMTPTDLIEVLEHLRFNGGIATVTLDRDVATYLIGLLRRQHSSARAS